MSRASIDVGDLPPDVRARLPQLGPNSPIAGEHQQGAHFDAAAAERSRRARTRQRAGAGFEQELEAVHRIYELEGRAKLHRLTPPMRKVGNQWIHAKGGAPCDFLGVARIAGVPRTVVFDAKSWTESRYTHEPEQLHQVRTLLDFAAVGAIAFLLLRDATLGLAYLVHERRTLAELALGHSILLCEPKRTGTKRVKGDRAAWTHHYPVVEEPSELLLSQSTPRWDWLGALSSLQEPR
jgi:penicillin-binding protein-related factor A (putative recombinase)